MPGPVTSPRRASRAVRKQCKAAAPLLKRRKRRDGALSACQVSRGRAAATRAQPAATRPARAAAVPSMSAAPLSFARACSANKSKSTFSEVCVARSATLGVSRVVVGSRRDFKRWAIEK